MTLSMPTMKSFMNLLVHQSNIGGSIEPTVLLVLVIRYLERIADHATNIGKRVAYIVYGAKEPSFSFYKTLRCIDRNI